MNRPSRETLRELLPAYLNRTISVDDRRAVEDWLRRDPDARAELAALQQLRSAAIDRPKTAPTPAVKQQLIARTRTMRQTSPLVRWLPWASGIILTAVVLIALWTVIRPGIGLRWSVVSGSPSGFRIYRAPAGSSNFELVQELPARPEVHDYTYVDTPVLPSQPYVYRVEGVEQEHVVQTQPVTVSTQAAFADQLMMLLTSAIIGLSIAVLMRYRLQLNSYHGLTKGNIR